MIQSAGCWMTVLPTLTDRWRWFDRIWRQCHFRHASFQRSTFRFLFLCVCLRFAMRARNIIVVALGLFLHFYLFPSLRSSHACEMARLASSFEMNFSGAMSVWSGWNSYLSENSNCTWHIAYCIQKSTKRSYYLDLCKVRIGTSLCAIYHKAFLLLAVSDKLSAWVRLFLHWPWSGSGVFDRLLGLRVCQPLS